MTERQKQLVLEAVKKGKLPRFLYKYRPLNERTDCIFENEEFWFAQPKSFNDPFDCNLSEVTGIKIREFTQYLDRHSLPDHVKKANVKSAKMNPGKIREFAMNSRKKTLNKYGILSLSQVYDSILMWSHYSENHTGIVIGIDVTLDPEFFITPMVVNYVESYKPINFFSRESDIEYTKRIMATKSSNWKYEKEVRIVKNGSGTYAIKKSAIKKIYFGCQTDPREAKRLRRILLENDYSGVKFFQGQQAYGKFKICFSKVA